MAQSRLERVGTIYTRINGLIKFRALKWEDRPLWYDLYEAFPPKEEPRFDRPTPNIPLRKIFYKEDKIRALFHKNNKKIGTTNFSNSNYKSVTQKFIEMYQKIEAQYDGTASEQQIYQEAIDLLKRGQDLRKDENISISSAVKDAQEKENKDKVNVKIDVGDIFKQ